MAMCGTKINNIINELWSIVNVKIEVNNQVKYGLAMRKILNVAPKVYPQE
jgi:hypothetical protein